MTQDQALKILKSGANVFLTGEPGAGKTHTVNTLVSYLRSCEIEPAITASTGIAATHIGGMTIHSWSGIGIRNKLDKYDLDKIASTEYISKRIRRTRVLIIDEISMLSTNMLDMLDMVCREVKQKGEAFGGMQIILVGDFFQLPPIVRRDDTVEKQSSLLGEVGRAGRVFAYDAGAWQRAELVVCYLTEQHRQDDSDYLSVLSAIRANNVSKEHLDHITARQIDQHDTPENTTKLFSHNIDVDQVNYTELGGIEGDVKSFDMLSNGNSSVVAALKRGCLSPEKLELKVGAVVMCTKNNPKEKFVNGTLGTVIDFDEYTGNPIIETKNGQNIVIAPMSWTVEENGKVKGEITQIPLRLAWAITVHKSQGMSLDTAVMDLSRVFEFGQGYVALSRLRRLSGLYLLGINERAFKVHPDILEKDIYFKEKSDEATKVFGKLDESELKAMHDNYIVAYGGRVRKKTKEKIRNQTKSKTGKSAPITSSVARSEAFAQKIAKMRETHPNAYRPWTDEQDKELEELFTSGSSVADLIKKFGRKRGAIDARLEKLGLKD